MTKLQEVGVGVITADLFRDIPSATGKITESSGDESEELQRIFSEGNFEIVIDLILTKVQSFERMVKALRSDDGNGWRIKQYIWAAPIAHYGMCEDKARRLFGKKRTDEITEDLWSPEACTTGDKYTTYNQFAKAWDLIHKRSVKLWNEDKFPYTYLFAPHGEPLHNWSNQMGEPQIWHGELQLLVSAPVTKPIHVYPVTSARATVHMFDFADAVAAAVDKREVAIGHHFHITMDEALSLTEYIRAVAKAVGKDEFPSEEDGTFIGGLYTQYVDRKWGKLSNAKAKQLLGWTHRPIDVWMQEMCDSFKPHLKLFFDQAYMPSYKAKSDSVDPSFPKEIGKWYSGVDAEL